MQQNQNILNCSFYRKFSLSVIISETKRAERCNALCDAYIERWGLSKVGLHNINFIVSISVAWIETWLLCVLLLVRLLVDNQKCLQDESSMEVQARLNKVEKMIWWLLKKNHRLHLLDRSKNWNLRSKVQQTSTVLWCNHWSLLRCIENLKNK